MVTKRALLFFSLLAAALLTAEAQNEPYKDHNLSASERAWDLLGRMTLEEKISQMTNESPAIERLDIPAYNWWNEALHGVARAGKATVFPQAIGMAATFDDKALHETFSIVSDEARAKYFATRHNGASDWYHGLTFWTPNINIFRDPRWGRGMETYGEDPYLTATMGVAVVKGLQGDGTGKYDKAHACAKHYAVHSGPEPDRHRFDVENLPARDLWETYLPAFKALVTEGNVKEVMCAYQRYEGQPCCSNDRLLTRILREEWHYDNIVVSDCGAIDDLYMPGHHETYPDAATASAAAVITGTDLECGRSYAALSEALEKGLITEEQINTSVYRLLRARFQLGMFDDDALVPWSTIPYESVECDAHVAKALQMARESMVLLVNNGRTLPLSKDIKVAVLGPNANDSVMMWANYNGYPSKTVTILEGIRGKLPDGSVYYEKGCDHVNNMILTSYYDKCRMEDHAGFKGTFWNNTRMEGAPVASGYFDRPLDWGKWNDGGNAAFMPGVDLHDFSARFESVYTAEETGTISFIVSANDHFSLTVNGELIGTEDFKHYSPREHTYVVNVEQGKAYDVVLDYIHTDEGASLSMDMGLLKEVDYQAVAARAADADVIVFVGGLSPSLEGEEMPVDAAGFKGGDRVSISLPAVQEKLLQALKATGKPVVFVNCSGSAVAMPWEATHLDAILQAWYGGEQGGAAVADALFGDYNPGGRLPVTFYASVDDLPAFDDYRMTGRTYRYFKGEPLFPFGFGLSYTTFTYGEATADKRHFKAGDEMTLTVPLKNTGSVQGDEVVQVYVRNLGDAEGPLKSLRAFRRVTLAAGEETAVEFLLPAATFESFNPATESMDVLPGEYELLYGGSSDDGALQKVAVTLE
ncbi:MAG: glycoside hydrolase family 3 C-terminal domain-containing protein [Prevotellaceae bacterium]|nr:glycoside hydrolase family 3 C-terminal domain-containing protein [Prevotellaceae bacterium]